jgi:hypothetical protein
MQNAIPSTFCLRLWCIIGDLFEVAMNIFYRVDRT